MAHVLIVCALIATQTPPATQVTQTNSDQVPQQRSEPAPELTLQIQRLLDYFERQTSRVEQPHRVAEIGAQASKRPDRIISRIYDIADLFIPAPAYPARHAGDWDESSRVFPELAAAGKHGAQIASSSAGSTTDRRNALLQVGGGMGGMGGMAGGRVPGSPEARPDLEQLIEAITQTIVPTSWSDVGGDSTITTLGTLLLVSATEEVQRQVDQFLRLLRQLWGTSRTVRVHAHWLWLNDTELGTLFPDGSAMAGTVNRQAWDALQMRLAQDREQAAGYRAHLACFDGQTVFVAAGDRRLSLSGIKPVLAAQAVAYEPEVKVLHLGAVLQITPTATNEAQAVILDVHSRVTELRDRAVGQEPDPTDRGEVARFAAGLRGNQIEEHHLASTLLVPVRTIVLVGGMSGKSNEAADQLYLFVEATVHELRPPMPQPAAVDQSNALPQPP
jgi:hypothetical protein